jgi:hypothetical protein
MPSSRLPLYVGALLMPLNAARQSPTLRVGTEVMVREDSFASKEISELDRLLQNSRFGNHLLVRAWAGAAEEFGELRVCSRLRAGTVPCASS